MHVSPPTLPCRDHVDALPRTHSSPPNLIFSAPVVPFLFSFRRQIWCFGPEGTGPNVVVDGTVGIADMGEIRGHIQTAWDTLTASGNADVD